MRMSDFSEFAVAAIPWIAMGLLIAVFCVSAANRKKTREKAINDNRKQQGSSQTAKRKGSSSHMKWLW
jgi:hypothetical protein